jgi:hypothetical protein
MRHMIGFPRVAAAAAALLIAAAPAMAQERPQPRPQPQPQQPTPQPEAPGAPQQWREQQMAQLRVMTQHLEQVQLRARQLADQAHEQMTRTREREATRYFLMLHSAQALQESARQTALLAERAQDMLRDREMLRDRDMQRDWERLREHLSAMDQQLDGALQTLERMQARIEPAAG